MNEISKRYNTRVEIPISAILETIFSDDNKDVETLSRWALKYGFVDLLEKKDGGKYYQLQNDYTKQSFYILLDKDERKQYDYENYLCEENDKLQQENQELKYNWNRLKEHLKNRYDNGTESISYRQVFMEIREAMQELEQGGEIND